MGSWSLIEGFGRVPRRLIWDNEPGIGRRGRLAAGVAEFCGTLATRVHQLKPRDPESKGVVERRNGFFETSFMPGRSFDSPADFNDQFAEWLERANRREVRTLKARPIDLVDADREAMLALPPIPPTVGWANQIRLGRDYYVRVDSNDYSVDPTAIGRHVTVTADLERVRVRLDGRVVADHARVWARHMTVTDPAHVEVARVLREAFSRPRAVIDDPLRRDLADYDRAFGVDGLRSGDGRQAATRSDAVKQIHYLAASFKAPRIPRPPPGSPTKPAMPAGPMRTTSPRCSNARSPPATPLAPRNASAGPGSPPARPSMTSTGTTIPPRADKSPRSPRACS